MWDMISREFVGSFHDIYAGVADVLPRFFVAIIFVAVG